MSYIIRDVSGAPLTVDSNTTPTNTVLPKFSLSDPTGTNITQSNPLWTQIPDCPVTAAASVSAANVVFSIDTTSYQSIAVQFSSVGTSNTVTFEVSNDNVNWTGVLGYLSTNTGTAVPVSVVASPINGSVYYFPVLAQFFRARVSTYTSGTVTAVYRLRDTPISTIGNYVGGGSVSISGTPNVAVTSTVSIPLKPMTAGGLSQFRITTPAATSNNLLLIKGTSAATANPGQIYGYHFFNAATTARYVHLYNLFNTSVTMGTTADTRVVGIPPGGSVSYSSDIGIPFNFAISVAITQGGAPTDNTIGSIAVNDVIGVIDYA